MYSDAAKRCSDEINLHTAMNNVGKYVAIRLSDGGSDHQAYDTRRDAIRHQLHESTCAYVRVPVDGMSIEDAEGYLALHRKVYDQGGRFCDPDGPEIVMPNTKEGLTKAILDPRSLRVGFRRG